ncbi:hypothetical protein VTJ04DRAFT_3160 [Mycothermus thermophilus]|uniref:uncharacterized protein n=1 Tax=Humicola insolens TaxID=85995 RepID=UPI0037443D63
MTIRLVQGVEQVEGPLVEVGCPSVTKRKLRASCSGTVFLRHLPLCNSQVYVELERQTSATNLFLTSRHHVYL